MQESNITENDFNTEELVLEMNSVLNKGLTNILREYTSRYNLLEATHQQIMKLPSVLNEFNQSRPCLENKNSNLLDKDKNNDIQELNHKIDKLEKKVIDCVFSVNCIIKLFQELNTNVNLQSKQQEIKSSIVTSCENENIKVIIKEEESDLSKEEEEEEEEEETEEEKGDDEEEEEEETEEEKGDEEEEEGEEKEVVEGEEKEVVEEEKEVVEEEEIESETSEKIEETIGEEEEEIFEIEIDDTTYCTNDDENGNIWLFENGDIGEKVGYFKENEPFFYADEK